MTTFRSDFLRESQARGFLYQGTDLEALDAHLCQGPVTAYIGFDATATSLHVGNLVQIMRLRLLQRTGHKPLVLIGDGTSRVGDPSGKDTQRQLLSDNQIEQNIAGFESIFAKYLDFSDFTTGARLVRNYSWLKELNYLDFLRDYGRFFSINRMLTFESVKARLDRDQPLSFLEFNYMVLQGYDFLELYRTHHCTLQLGGSDQWGNIISGIDLVRRVENKTVYGSTAALITTADGKKMGKTAQGAVWLNADLLSTFDYWQFWRNTHDNDVGRFLRLFTDLPIAEIERLEDLQGAERNHAKMILADEATKLCHGMDAVKAARETAASLFSASETNSVNFFDTLPTVIMTDAQLDQGISIVDIIVEANLAASKGEARRLIRSRAFRVQDNIIQDEKYRVTRKDIQTDQPFIKLSAGKKRHAVIKISEKGK